MTVSPPRYARWLLPLTASLSAVSAILLGFVLVPPVPALNLVQFGGYFLLLTAFILFVVAGVRLWQATTPRPSWTHGHIRLLGASVVFALLWQVNETHGFKVLMDEPTVNATAMSMHFDREIFVPWKAHDVNGMYFVLGGAVDKRPSFFPLVLSLIHDVSGYRTGNVFVLNALLSVVLLFLAGCLGRRLGGQENAGLAAVALLGGLPLLGLNATGGSFEVLNLVMICACMLLANRFLTRPDVRSQDALVLGTVLLAQTRYESAIFVCAVGLILALAWWHQRRPIWSWSLTAAPLLLLLVPLQNKVFDINARGYWQLTEGTDQPFMVKFLPENFGHAVNFLFTVDGFQSSSPVLSTVGVICTLFVVTFLIRRWRQIGTEPELGAFAAFGVAIFANFALLLCYHWGQLDDFVATRLALPLLLLFTLSAAFALGRWISRPAVWWPVLTVPVAWAFVAGVPLSARAEATLGFLTYQEVAWQQRFVREQRDAHVLFALPSPLAAVLERKAALSIEALAERPEQTAHHLALASYRDIYVFQRLKFDPVANTWNPYSQSALGPEFILETIEERRFKPLYKMRLSRIKAMDLALQSPRPDGWKASFPPFQIKSAGIDAPPEERFVQEYLSQLP